MIHEVLDKYDVIILFFGQKSFPFFWNVAICQIICICHNHCNHKLQNSRSRISITILLLTELPKCPINLINSKLFQYYIVISSIKNNLFHQLFKADYLNPCQYAHYTQRQFFWCVICNLQILKLSRIRRIPKLLVFLHLILTLCRNTQIAHHLNQLIRIKML